MIQLNRDNETVLDLLERISVYNTLPNEQRREPTIVQLTLDKSRWFSLLALKEMNYKGLGELLEMEAEDSVVATYKNVQVVYNGDDRFDYDGSTPLDLMRVLEDWTINANRPRTTARGFRNLADGYATQGLAPTTTVPGLETWDEAPTINQAPAPPHIRMREAQANAILNHPTLPAGTAQAIPF